MGNSPKDRHEEILDLLHMIKVKLTDGTLPHGKAGECMTESFFKWHDQLLIELKELDGQ